MSYEAWRITYQDSEHAARAAYAEAQRLAVENEQLKAGKLAAVEKPTWFDAFFRNVCELPDRSSPDDDPGAIVASEHELLNCMLSAMEEEAGL